MSPAVGPEAGPPTASASTVVAATPEAVWAVLVDLDELAALAEEAESMTWVRGVAARPGAVFTGRNRHGRRTWSTRCAVTAADPGRRFAFDVAAGPLPVARWQYDVEPAADGSRVTESTWDRRPRWSRRVMGLVTGVADRDAASQAHIEATLARLQERFAS